MLCDVVVRRRRRRRRRRWAHAPVIHAASHFDHKKRVAWVPISMHTCGSFFYNYGAPLGGPSGRRSSAIMSKAILCCVSFACNKMQNQIFGLPEVRKSALFLKGFQTGKKRWRDSRSIKCLNATK